MLLSTFDSSAISIIQSFKLLGVTIDANMKFTSHCAFVVKKPNSCIGLIYRYRRLLSVNTLKLIFNCVGFLYITYCMYAYFDFIRASDMRMLERKYVRCGRAILNDNISPVSVILKTLNW